MKVKRFVSPYLKTNNFLIEVVPKKYIGIDLGYIDIHIINSFLKDNKGELIGYFLTHAHADHTYGIKAIFELYNIPIYCSSVCSEEIANSRKNFSYYSDDIPTFEYKLPFHIIEDLQPITLGDKQVIPYLVPGHTPGCTMFKVADALFTGDFLMTFRTPLNFPNSSKLSFSTSLSKVKELFQEQKNLITCFPGHGESFFLSDYPFFDN
jgi:hydroxyacylglutathione hydrolase